MRVSAQDAVGVSEQGTPWRSSDERGLRHLHARSQRELIEPSPLASASSPPVGYSPRVQRSRRARTPIGSGKCCASKLRYHL